MNNTEFEWQHCGRKIKYNKVKNAENTMKKKRKTGMIVRPYNIYRCKYCGKFHIGHKKIIDKFLKI